MLIINKDVTTVERGIVAHGVNCMGKFNAGVAKVIRDKWPKVYEGYINQGTGKKLLGTCRMYNIDEEQTLWVANLYTQVFYGYNAKFADINAIRSSLNNVFWWASVYELPIYIPKIGCGLGGLSWENDVESVVLDLEKIYNTSITVCEWK